MVERVGASISVAQADQIIERASRSPDRGRRARCWCSTSSTSSPPRRAEAAEDHRGAAAGHVLRRAGRGRHPRSRHHRRRGACASTSARCRRDAIVERLVAEGVDPERAAQAAIAAAGDLRRARLLATDDRLALRRQAWHDVPDRLDGTGATAVQAADELLAMIDDAMAPLRGAPGAGGRRARGAGGAAGRAGLGSQGARGAPQARAAPLPRRRAALRAHELARRYRDELATSARPGPRSRRSTPSRRWPRGWCATPTSAAVPGAVREARRVGHLSDHHVGCDANSVATSSGGSGSANQKPCAQSHPSARKPAS